MEDKQFICPQNQKPVYPADCIKKVAARPTVGGGDLFRYCREYCTAHWARGEKIVIRKDSPIASMGAIEKGIPIPTVNRKGIGGTNSSYPFKTMEIGDSFSVRAKSGSMEDRRKTAKTLVVASSHFCKKWKPEWKFTTRQTETGARIWRVK